MRFPWRFHLLPGGLAFAFVALLSIATSSVAIAHGFGAPVLAVLVAGIALATCRQRAWALVPGVLLVALIPVLAGRGHIASLSLGRLGLATGLAIVLALGSHRGLPIRVQALAPVMTLVAFGVADGGGIGPSVKAQYGLLLIWIVGSVAGGAISLRRSLLSPLLWVLSPTAVLALLEFVGSPDYWANATHATLYARWPTFGGFHRALSTFGHPIPAGAAFAALGMVALTTRPLHFRLVATLYFAATLATLSRSAFVGIGAGLLTIVLVSPRAVRLRRFISLSAAACVAVGIVSLSAPLNAAVSSRFATNDNAGRVESLDLAETSVLHHPRSVLFGGGFGGAEAYLNSIGGNHLTNQSTGTLIDNGFVTSLYDFGLIPMAVFLSILAFLAARAGPDARHAFLPPLVAVSATLLFFDGLSWPSTSFFFFLFVGALCGSLPMLNERATAPRRSRRFGRR